MNRPPAQRVYRHVIAFSAALLLGTGSVATAQTTPTDGASQVDAAIIKAQADGKPVVEVLTNLGALIIELDPAKAPKSVENFLSYVDSKFYDGTVFHRVIEGFMIQGGGLDLRLEKKETRAPVENEADNGLANAKFSVALARTSEPHSATSQFFINTADNEFLNHKAKTQAGWGYTVIGKLIGGQAIAEWMSKAPTGPAGPFTSDVPLIPMVIESAIALEKAAE